MLCRLCLIYGKECFNMFNSRNVHTSVAVIIAKHFWFEPKINDEVSEIICVECWEKIEDFHKFYTEIEAAQKKFETLKKEDENQSSEIGEINISNEDQSSETGEINISNKDQSSEICEINISNKEIVNDLVDLINDDSVSNNLASEKTYSNETEIFELGEPKKDSEKKKLRKHKIKAQTHGSTKNKILKREEFDKKISSFLTLSCDLCSKIMPNFSKLKLHFKETHNVPGYVICCNKKFTQNQFLIGHIDAHLNPENYRCLKCDQTLSTRKNYEKHMEKKHLNKVQYACNSCSRKFDFKTLLEKHLPIHWPKEEWKIKCTYCDRLYPTEYFLKNHVTDIHEKCKICQFCGKSFSSRRFREHQTSHETTASKVQCNICGAWLKKTGLRIHMKNHQEALEIHKCNICGKISPNKGALKIHIKNHETAKCHQCSICEKGFKRPLALRQHMATHTGESLYQCKYCTKSFIYDSAYHTHKKKEHPSEYLKEKKSIQRTDFIKCSIKKETVSSE